MLSFKHRSNHRSNHRSSFSRPSPRIGFPRPFFSGSSHRFLTRFWVAAIAISLGACTATSGSNPEGSSSGTVAGNAATPADGEKALQVVTTFLPMTQFTKAVAGDRAQVTQLLPTNIGPHDYQAKPTDAQSLANADVLIQNGLEIESFLAPMIENAANSNLKVVDTSEGLELIAMVEEVGEEGHDHDHGAGNEKEDHSKEDHSEEKATSGKSAQATEGAAAEHEEHEHGEFDPHIWLDPVRAIEQVENIRDGLIAADPTGEAEYTANAAAYIEKIKELDQEIRTTLTPFAGKTFVTFHDFANYFAGRYGLKAEFLVNIPEENPSPDDVKRVIEAAQSSDLKTLLTESEASAGPFQALAQDLNVKISTFKSNEIGDASSIEPDAYLRVMRENVANLKAAFAGS
ncbi:MAG: zinc ABC transporter solute-binding protein [Synechococcales cyanobacterium RU_4_20]|nr:zinc ABC transporter solute-binding protein [Synechococcales cyanobacterium RU_4_20]NJR68777.1 zinc ABC transporter solute-binding protein [Synechococcales cyanobacterium CRU_2_2]